MGIKYFFLLIDNCGRLVDYFQNLEKTLCLTYLIWLLVVKDILKNVFSYNFSLSKIRKKKDIKGYKQLKLVFWWYGQS